MQLGVALPLMIVMKPIRLSNHASRYLSKRGFTIAEVEETIRTSPWNLRNSADSIAEKISHTGKNGTGRFMRQNKVARCSSTKRQKLLS